MNSQIKKAHLKMIPIKDRYDHILKQYKPYVCR